MKRPEETDDTIARITQCIVEHFNPQRIVLFGSRARGDARSDSDYDLLIIAPSSEPRWHRAAPVYVELAALKLPRDVDVVWWTPEEIAKWRNVRTHFITTVLREGRELYGHAA